MNMRGALVYVKNSLKPYLYQRRGPLFLAFFLFSAFNLYFFFFIQKQQVGYLLYLDLLLFIPFFIGMSADFARFQKREKEKQKLLVQSELICRLSIAFENKEIAEHDVELLSEQLRLRGEENQDLQDFAARWCHELKLPLSAVLLMNERISDPTLRRAMREPLEKINQQLNTMLLGCRLQSPLLDLQIKEVNLFEEVKASVRNNQFFLIQQGFELILEVEPLCIHTDPQWLVYALDQIIQNAVKYGKKEKSKEEAAEAIGGEKKKRLEAAHSVLKFWTEKEKESVILHIKDYGQGIHPQDIGRIFEKGYTGKNFHNGKYKSTGMGLYMAKTIMERMGHRIKAESIYGEYSRFSVIFRENSYFLNG